VKSFELCLMPFALNQATEFINPTKALEYMATGKPIISTRVEEVVMQFSEVVVIAESRADFIAKAARYSVWPDQTRIKRGFELVRRNSWESIVGQLEKLVAATLASKRALAVDAA
jgi:glycosyltransferase involved in cell wall biosynthesis